MYKKCCKCKEVKPISEFHLHKKQKDGHQNFCKECKKYPATKIKEGLLSSGLKKCGHCKNIKPLTEFNKEKRRQDGRSPWCKQCKSSQNKIYIDPEKNRGRNREYRKSEGGKRKIKEYARISSVYKENHRKSTKIYTRRHPERAMAHRAVQVAVHSGKLHPVRSLRCFHCGIKQASHYHHHKGYAKEHWLDVEPVCTGCHKAIHHG